MAEGTVKPWEMDFGGSHQGKKPWEMEYAGAPARTEPKPPPPLSDGLSMPRQMLQNNVGLGEAALNMGTSMVAKPASDVAGLAAVVRDMFSKKPGGDPQGFQRDVQERMTYEPRTPTGKTMAQYNPIALLARLFGAAGDKAESTVAPPETSGPARAALGSGVKEAVQQLPAFLGAKAPAAVDAAAGGMKNTARGVMTSALKPELRKQQQTMPGTNMTKAEAGVDTLLNEGVNVSKGGAEKLQGRIEVLNDKIKKLIDSSPAAIDKQTVGYYAQSAIDKFSKQVDKAKDVKAIQDVWDRFLADVSIPDKIPVKSAQDLKQGTNRALGEKSFGELQGAEKEANKQLARGLKEEIARAVPQVRKLNAEESQLLNALSLVERRALMEANKNPAGLGWLTTSPEKFAAYMADRSGLFKSLLARMINTGAEVLPPLGGPATVGAGVAASQDRQLAQPPR